MTKFVIATAVLLGAFFGSAGGALAQRYTNYPVCAIYSFRTQSCAFQNFAQCYMSVSGRGGWCEANPSYQPSQGRRAAKRSRT